jgi:hypothetical protein
MLIDVKEFALLIYKIYTQGLIYRIFTINNTESNTLLNNTAAFVKQPPVEKYFAKVIITK